MTTYLGKSCSFCLPRVPFVNCRQFMYLVISLLVLRAGYGIWLYQFLIIAYFFTFYSVVTLKIRSSYQNQFFSYHNDKIRKVWPEYIIWFKRQDADNLFWSKFDIQRASGTLKMRSVSPKPYHFIPTVSVVFLCKFGQIHQWTQEMCRQGSFLVLMVRWPWQLGQGHKNLFNSFNYPSDTIHNVWPESIIWFKRYM